MESHAVCREHLWVELLDRLPLEQLSPTPADFRVGAGGQDTPLEPLRVLHLFPAPTETHPIVTAKGEKVDGCPEGAHSPRQGTM